MVICTGKYQSTEKDFLVGWFNGSREKFITFKLAAFMLMTNL